MKIAFEMYCKHREKNSALKAYNSKTPTVLCDKTKQRESKTCMKLTACLHEQYVTISGSACLSFSLFLFTFYHLLFVVFAARATPRFKDRYYLSNKASLLTSFLPLRVHTLGERKVVRYRAPGLSDSWE